MNAPWPWPAVMGARRGTRRTAWHSSVVRRPKTRGGPAGGPVTPRSPTTRRVPEQLLKQLAHLKRTQQRPAGPNSDTHTGQLGGKAQ